MTTATTFRRALRGALGIGALAAALALPAAASAAKADVTALEFGQQVLLTPSAAKTINITGQGTVRRVGRNDIDDRDGRVKLYFNCDVWFCDTNDDEFTVINRCTTKIELGKSCSIDVTFTPNRYYDRSATMTVETDRGHFTLPLKGFGIAAPGADGQPGCVVRDEIIEGPAALVVDPQADIPSCPRGPQGEQGEQGPQGLPGCVVRPAGYDRNTEDRAHSAIPDCPQGPQGDKGDQGADGDDGAKGDTGATGSAGSDGMTITGPTGVTGATGPAGPAGAPAVDAPQSAALVVTRYVHVRTSCYTRRNTAKRRVATCKVWLPKGTKATTLTMYAGGSRIASVKLKAGTREITVSKVIPKAIKGWVSVKVRKG